MTTGEANPAFEGRRFAVAMWDFSWLVRRENDENEYRDWEAVLSGLAERGYDCVRIDAFPHLIAAAADGRRADSFRILPQRKRFPWGNHRPVEVQPLRSLVEFVRLAKKHGRRVALSSWFNDDESHARDEIRTPDDLTRVWSGALDALEREGLGECIAWVDLCNEFPLGEWLPGAYQWIFHRRWPNAAPLVRPWKPERLEQVNRFFRECIPALKKAHPGLRYTFSFQRLGFDKLRQCDVSAFDLVEAHLWLAELVGFGLLSGHAPGLLCLPGGLALHRALGPRAFDLRPAWWIAQLHRRMADWAAWARERRLPLCTSEGWGPINYSDAPRSTDGAEWRWVKEVGAAAANKAVELGWTGICTSNFCQPHFPGMWADVAWHRTLTSSIAGQIGARA